MERWLLSLPARLKSLARRRRFEEELDEEFEYHLDQQTAAFIANGMSDEDARYAARRAIGGLDQRKEECRDTWMARGLSDAVRDVRYGARALLKSPTFSAVAAITLALAICANAVVFGVLNGFILRPLNVPQSDTLWANEYGDNSPWHSYPNYLDLRQRNRSFEDLAAFFIAFVALDTGGDPAESHGFAVSGNYFDVLKVPAHLGRVFHASDERGPGSAPYIVLAHSYWHSRFHDDPGVIGRTVRINKRPATIVGVTPPEFEGTLLFLSAEFFTPMVYFAPDEVQHRGLTNTVFEFFGHLKPGVTPEQAVADINSVGAYIGRTYPNQGGRDMKALSRPGLTAFGRPARAFVAALMALATLILLAACANLGSLFAARATDRTREVALRLALGAARNRIVRALFTEAMLVSVAGGAVGLIGSITLLNQLSAWRPFGGAPVHMPAQPDARVYVVAALLALASGILFAIVPARQVLRTDAYQAMKRGAASTGRFTAREILLGVQIALCAVLVTSSMVALRGLAHSMWSSFGFEPRNALMVGASLDKAGYTLEQAPVMQKKLMLAMESIPGVERVGMVNHYPPLAYGAGFRTNIFRESETDLRPSNAAASAFHYYVSPGYFAAAQTKLVAGSGFTELDDAAAPVVAVPNRTLAVMMFGSMEGALGRHFKLPDGKLARVAGIAEDGKYLSVAEEARPAVFLASLQSPAISSYFVLRSSRDIEQLSAEVRAKVRELDPGLPADVEPWTRMLQVALFPGRMATLSLGVLGAMGAVLSITGVFGMAAYSVSRRMRELGIRVALGAQRRQLLAAALGRAVRLLAMGSLSGLLIGVLASRVLSVIVYQATPRDPIVIAGAVGAMGLVGVLATFVPARRALRLSPAALLRED